MPTTEHEGSATATAQGPRPHQAGEQPLAPVLERTGVEHWQRRLDRARATRDVRPNDA